jgi:penicillin amidase
MHLLRNQAHNPHLDLGGYHSLQALILDAFIEAVQELEDWQKDHHKPYKWGDYRETNIQHLARIPSFSAQHLQVNGGKEIVNANNGGHGVSMRLIVSLEKQPKAWLIYPGGQPGNPGNPYYVKFIDAWCKGEYIPLSLNKQQGNKKKGFSLTLLP